ncbi:S41 family peptidase [bacterium]|nr:S41 family peptidase [bacterium]
MQERPSPRRNSGSLIIIAALLAAFLLGTWAGGGWGTTPVSGLLPNQFSKFREVVKLVESVYVDAPNDSLMTEGAIEGLLEKLDPHSVYIPPAEQNRISERFEGEFSGIGIQFEIRNDLLTVVSPIPGTPADRMGLRAGDKIVEINGVSAVGITNDQVLKRLRGPEGSTVNIQVRRNGRDPFDLELTRGRIPIHSVEAAFLLNDGKTGYIMISQFTSVTESELDNALARLDGQGMEQLILDLRGNSGGYRAMAKEVADRFIHGGNIIATTRGRARGSSDTLWATDSATHTYLPLAVLVSNGSASASEIVAGAIQDHDRGLILGQQTFGKGLVQLPFELDDGSVVRVTISRWYTPAGRCVQRPYDEGIGEYLMNAYRHGNSDSTLVDSTAEKFYTRTGRVMYGATGIRPDVEIEPATLSEYAAGLLSDRVLFNWAQDYADGLGRPTLEFEEFLRSWSLNQRAIRSFIQYADSEGHPFDKEGWELDKDYLLMQIKAEVAQRMYNGRDFLWQVLIDGDATVDSALVRMGEADRLARSSSLRENG